MSYFNTTSLSGDELKQAVSTAENQDSAVLLIMSDGHHHSPSAVWKRGIAFGRQWLLTSVRRSMSSLAEDGKLIKCEYKLPGPYGRQEHVWIIANDAA